MEPCVINLLNYFSLKKLKNLKTNNINTLIRTGNFINAFERVSKRQY